MPTIKNISLDLQIVKKSWDKAKEMSDQPTVEQSKGPTMC